MPDHVILTDADGGTAVLTTNSNGILVLRVAAAGLSTDFGPGDVVDDESLCGGFTAGFIVASWANDPDRTDSEREAARRFLSQWPEGPQAEGRHS